MHCQYFAFQNSMQISNPNLEIVSFEWENFGLVSNGSGWLGLVNAVGSVVLTAIGRVLLDEIRETDLAVRYGGDEFVVLLPHASLKEATAFAERVLAHIRRIRPAGLEVGVSIGVASLMVGDSENLEVVLKHSDTAAYTAKRRGGNQVAIHGEVATS